MQQNKKAKKEEEKLNYKWHTVPVPWAGHFLQC